jgi:hypothetical protein
LEPWQGAYVLIDPTTHETGQRVAIEIDAVGRPGATVIDVGINRIDAGGGKSRIGGAGRGRDHAGSGRGRADDHRLPAGEHADRLLPGA